MSSVRAVIWDFGGVISTSPFEAFRAFERARGLPQDFLRQVNARNHLDNAWARFERSAIDLETFDRAFLAETTELGHPVGGREVVALLGGEIRPAMVNALRLLRPVTRLGLITNNVCSEQSPGAEPSGRQEVLALFQEVIESAKVGIRKPDPAIYRMMCDALAVAPEQAVFLDDLGINLKPAQAMGMKTIKVDDPDRALEELEALVGLRLRA